MVSLDSYQKFLSELVSMKSISADSSCKTEVVKTSKWLAKQFREHGFAVNVVEGYGNPVIVASYVADPSFKTCLLYGHYDVQPAAREEGWQHDPFVLTKRENRLFGRGAIDDKGQVSVHMLTVFDLVASKDLGYNIKFMVEGNEEVGSPMLGKFIADHKKLLASDFVLISDGELTAGMPTIEIGFRGNLNATLTIATASNDLHSGLYGGVAPNSIHEAAKFVSGLFDADQKVLIEGFYDGADPIDHTIHIPFALAKYQKNTTTKALLAPKNHDFYTATGQLPSLEVSGMHAGYTGEGYRNSIPGKTIVKINMRIVPHQTPEKIEAAFRKHVAKVLPEYVDSTVAFDNGSEGIKLDMNNTYIQRAEQILQQVYGAKPVRKYVGGSIPIVTDFERLYQLPQLLIPLANEDGMMHGLNENFDLEFVEKALKFDQEFFQKRP